MRIGKHADARHFSVSRFLITSRKAYTMQFNVKNENKDAKITLTERQVSPSITELLVEIAFPTPTSPSPVRIRWSLPCNDMYLVWNAGGRVNMSSIRPNWGKNRSQSRLASGAPLHSLIAQNGNNRLTVSLSDAKTPCEIACGIVEENARLECDVTFFTIPIDPISTYCATVRIDLTDEPFYSTVRRVDAWWQDECGYPAAPVPETAKRAMYSTWYSFHQRTVPEEILEQCRLAKEMGMEAVIVDDGWQTDDGNRGYAFCGDWEPTPTKIPDMKAFADGVHALGMKMILWYSVPFVGVGTKAYQRFRDMHLGFHKGNEEFGWVVLDPRYPEVRKYLTDTYRNAMLDWGIDGFKLDFIDSFRLFPTTRAEDPRRDVVSLEEAVDLLLSEVTSALRAIDPDVLIEFRQTYVGPVIRKYGNMFRVGDCPADSIVNRTASVQLRYILGGSAVHSDMLMWSYEDTPAAAAKQIIATLFTVPQISVMIDRMPADHQKMLRNYMDFWNTHRDVLLEGELIAEHPEANYSQVRASKDGTVIAVAYTETPIPVENTPTRFIAVNGSGCDAILLRAREDQGSFTVRIYDCLGICLTEEQITLTPGVYSLDVPDSGRLELTR